VRGSINGENIHYGTPRNPCAADRVPGGSSSGSAVAVGAKLVDFSLGHLFFPSIGYFCQHFVNNFKCCYIFINCELFLFSVEFHFGFI